MSRGIRIFVVLLIASLTLAHAQDPAATPETLDAAKAYDLATTWIVDQDPRQRAWAAELIAKYQFAALYPKLLTALNEFQPEASGKFTGTPDELALEAIADALIKSQVPVPAMAARKLYAEFPALAIILLSRSIDDNRAALLSILDDTKVDEVWLASANLLARNPSPEFVIKLLDDFNVFVRMSVSEPGMGMGASFGDCFSPSQAKFTTPDQWPPISVYSLHLAKNVVSFASSVTSDPAPWRGSPCSRRTPASAKA